MANKTLHSSQITFIDMTDDRKLEVYINSNLPTSQIYNANTNTYTPDWSNENLILSADVYLSSKNVTNDSRTTITWFKKIGTENKFQISTDKTITISANEMYDSINMITYSCEVSYEALTAYAQQVFTRIDTGLNGKDGTSVNIEGTAYCNKTLTNNDVGKSVLLYADVNFTQPIDTSILSNGDAYIVQGFMCIYDQADNEFICAGMIQGPSGDNAKNIILNADNQIFKVNKSNEIYPSTITVMAQSINTSITDWTYSIDGGSTFSKQIPNGLIRNNNKIVITGADVSYNSIVIKASDGIYYDTLTIYKVFDGADGNAGESASSVFLTNENIIFLADSDGKSLSNAATCNIIAYTGNTKVTPTIGSITGVPDGITVTVNEPILNEIPLTITVPRNIDLSSYGTIYIPIYSPIVTTLTLRWQRSNAAKDSITFQIYAPNGYLLSASVPSLILQTFAYDGANEISTGATYKWSEQIDDEWTDIEYATNKSITLSQENVLKSKSYRCEMNYRGNTYYATATVQDKSDIYNSIMCVSSNANALTGTYYWVVYVILYSEEMEVDPLLGPISVLEPESPLVNDYWYCVDPDSLSITIKKYNGSAWDTSTDTQKYQYDWCRIDDGNKRVSLGGTEKVKIIACNDFTSAATFQCAINQNGEIITNCAMSLTDVTDPIVSDVMPTDVKDGQIWMKKNSDGTFLMLLWDALKNEWTPLNADTKNVVYTTKPSSYKAGDLWIVESDVAHEKYLKGTLLQAQATSSIYSDDDWDTTLNYDMDIKDIKDTLDSYAQYLTINDEGLRMGARSSSGDLSPFTALFTNTELAFYEGNDKLVYLSNNALHTTRAEVETDLYVAKTISLQDFQWLIEDNGSMSLIVNK